METARRIISTILGNEKHRVLMEQRTAPDLASLVSSAIDLQRSILHMNQKLDIEESIGLKISVGEQQFTLQESSPDTLSVSSSTGKSWTATSWTGALQSVRSELRASGVKDQPILIEKNKKSTLVQNSLR